MRAVNCSDFVMDLSVARCTWLCSSSHCPPVFFSPLWRETNFFVPWHSLSRRSITRGNIVHSKRLAHVDESRNVFPFLSSRPRSSIRVLRDILNSASVARDNVRNNAIGNISAHSRALEIFEGDKGGKGASAFANGDCTQCVHVGAAIPQLVTYVPFVAGGRWRSRALPSFTPSCLLTTSTFAPTLLFVRQTTALFIQTRHFSQETRRRRRRRRRRQKIGRMSWPLTFVKLCITRKYSLQGRVRPQKAGRVHPYGLCFRLRKVARMLSLIMWSEFNEAAYKMYLRYFNFFV